MDTTTLCAWASQHMPIGSKYGELTVLETLKQTGLHWTKAKYFARCSCSCGNNRVFVALQNLRGGTTKSCGCVMRDGRIKTKLSRTHIGRTWRFMMRRCYLPNDPAYPNYGGRGIFVAPEWHDLQQFHHDMSGSYAPGLTLERINNNGPYSPTNCKWASRKEQSRNRRSNITLTFNGLTMCAEQWAEQFGIPGNTLRNRIRKLNWPIQQALTTPVNRRQRTSYPTTKE